MSLFKRWEISFIIFGPEAKFTYGLTNIYQDLWNIKSCTFQKINNTNLIGGNSDSSVKQNKSLMQINLGD